MNGPRNYGQHAVSLAGNFKREKAMTTQHTPTPWHARVEAGLDLVTAQRDHVCGGINEESVFSLHRPPAERKANAAFIVRACNAHDELVAALRKCEAVLNQIGNATGTEQSDAWRSARAVLAKVSK